MAIWNDEGRTSVGNIYLTGTAQPSFYLGLFKNSSEPVEAAVMTGISGADQGFNNLSYDNSDKHDTAQC